LSGTVQCEVLEVRPPEFPRYSWADGAGGGWRSHVIRGDFLAGRIEQAQASPASSR
jgi:hypothetical protein